MNEVKTLKELEEILYRNILEADVSQACGLYSVLVDAGLEDDFINWKNDRR